MPDYTVTGVMDPVVADLFMAKDREDLLNRLKQFISGGKVLSLSHDDFHDFETIFLLATCTDNNFVLWFANHILKKSSDIQNPALRDYWWKLYRQNDRLYKRIYRALLCPSGTDGYGVLQTGPKGAYRIEKRKQGQK